MGGFDSLKRRKNKMTDDTITKITDIASSGCSGVGCCMCDYTCYQAYENTYACRIKYVEDKINWFLSTKGFKPDLGANRRISLHIGDIDFKKLKGNLILFKYKDDLDDAHKFVAGVLDSIDEEDDTIHLLSDNWRDYATKKILSIKIIMQLP
jgi:hypothetical protein